MTDVAFVGVGKKISRILFLQLAQINVKATLKRRLFFQDISSLDPFVKIILINGEDLNDESYKVLKKCFPEARLVSFGKASVIDRELDVIKEDLEDAFFLIK